jgi:hypothetical protein
MTHCMSAESGVTVLQDELVAILRSDGRRQAAQRIMKHKRETQHTGPQYAAAMAAQQLLASAQPGVMAVPGAAETATATAAQPASSQHTE